tara:strand:- start:1079 stop:1963 length:885 start_codon:yes stop_codon:yes gene_type:complete
MVKTNSQQIKIITTAAEAFIKSVPQTVKELYSKNLGSEIIGPVKGRPISEDLQIIVDKECDDLFKSIITNTGLSFDIYSEHGTYNINHTSSPEYIAVIDPFDGSSLYRNGIPAEWWSVFSIFDNDFKPILGRAIDIVRSESYEAKSDSVSMQTISSESKITIKPSSKTSFSSNVWIASYLMDPSYLNKWYLLVENILTKWPATKIWPNGGSSIYPWLSRGIVDAYLMVNEPKSETDPGLSFAYFSGYPIYEIDNNNQLIPYQFVPQNNNERSKILLACCTAELAHEIINECNII